MLVPDAPPGFAAVDVSTSPPVLSTPLPDIYTGLAWQCDWPFFVAPVHVQDAHPSYFPFSHRCNHELF